MIGRIAPKFPGVVTLLNRLLQGTGVTITQSGQSVTISIGQDVSTSANATFNNLILSALATNSFVYSNNSSQLTTTVAPTNGQLLIGSTGAAPIKANLSATTNQTTITNGPGTITIGTAQDINTSSSPTFANGTYTGTLTVQGLSATIGNGGTSGNNASINLNGQSGSGFPGATIAGKRNGVVGWTLGDYSAVNGGSSMDFSFQNFNSGAAFRWYNSVGTLLVTIGNAGDISSAATILTGVYTVATLPAGAEGKRAAVTDATSTTFLSVVAGGGTNHVPVYHNGTNWVIA